MTHLRTLVPVYSWLRNAIVIGIFIASYAADFFTSNPERMISHDIRFFYVFLIVIFAVILDTFIQFGYRVSYSELTVSWRKCGLSRDINKETVINFDDIDYIYPGIRNFGMVPFELILINSKSDKKQILFYLDYF